MFMISNTSRGAQLFACTFVAETETAGAGEWHASGWTEGVCGSFPEEVRQASGP